MHILHLTTVHRPLDARIFIKQACSLAAAGHDVSLACFDPPADRDGVRFVSLGERPASRLQRMYAPLQRAVAVADNLKPDVIQIHDPELLPAALVMARRGHAVVFDSHEDAPKDILTRKYLTPALKKGVATGYAALERYVTRRIAGVIGATDEITDRLRIENPRALTVRNFPAFDDFPAPLATPGRKDGRVAYIGGLAENRGLFEMIQAANLVGCPLHFAGPWSHPVDRAAAERLPGWHLVKDHGVLDRAGVHDMLSHMRIGLAILHPVPTFLTALIVKVFEYMAAGVPFIVSDFPIWRHIVGEARCGLCVDPFDTKAVARAIEQLLTDDGLAEEMGRNGRAAFEKHYNWSAEFPAYSAFLASVARGH